MILLDTDICLSILKGKISGNDLSLISENEIAVASITAEELFYAANRSSDPVGNRILTEKFLLTVKILHSDLATMKYLADVQLSLKRHGKKASYGDLVIYSLAKVYGARLITGNSKRYCFT
jgi:predicted nucleic acid-binding protein